MKKILTGILALTIITACGTEDKNHFTVVSGEDDTSYLADIKSCPKIHIRQKDFRVVQSEAGKRLFEIQAIGYEGFCYFHEKSGKYRAVIKPQFKIKRLNSSDVNDVQFSYYLETVEGPKKYLGRKTYFSQAYVTPAQKELKHVAKGGELTIPNPGSYDLDIYMGLYAEKFDSESKN